MSHSRPVRSGAALKADYRKLPSYAWCSECGPLERTVGTDAAALATIRLAATRHASGERHQVTLQMTQTVTFTPIPEATPSEPQS